jgi:hypothetical protein
MPFGPSIVELVYTTSANELRFNNIKGAGQRYQDFRMTNSVRIPSHLMCMRLGGYCGLNNRSAQAIWGCDKRFDLFPAAP